MPRKLDHGSEVSPKDAHTATRRIAMNGPDQRQFATEGFHSYDHDPTRERGRDGRRRRVAVEAIVQAFSFGRFRIVPYARLLERAGSPISLSSRAFDLLCILVSRPG